ncbi:MAG: UpxY family transcription antiterminator [Calditrichaeota bacterium]|nr:UpxY family transcription antiterminator [Calditrichota bacterium]
MISQTDPYWYAFVTRPRHEKRVEKQLRGNGVDCYLPLHRTLHQWKDRRKYVEVPLFSCYIFAHISYFKRYDVLTVPGVVRIVSIGNQPTPVRDEEIEAVRALLASKTSFELSQELHYGDRVRIVEGPLAGVEGELVDFRCGQKVALNVGVIGQSLLVEIEQSKLVRVAASQEHDKSASKWVARWRSMGLPLRE